MYLYKPALVALLLGTTIFGADAKIAKRDTRTVTQPDGTTLRIKVVGDEFMHFVTTETGELLYQNPDGLYTYGRIDTDGAVVSTGIEPSTSAQPVQAVNIKDINLDNIARLRENRVKRTRAEASYNANPMSTGPKRAAAQSGVGLCTTTYPHTGSPKGLIILVEYSDVSFRLSNPGDYFHDMINGANFTQYKGTGSALQYFTDQSKGKFVPSFDVLGPVKLPNPQSYYGGNDRYGNDLNPEMMVVDAVKLLDPTVDFSIYDTDKDGYVDNVYIFYAGQGEADYGSANTVWPHSWDLRSAGVSLKVDNVYVNHYACSNEWNYNSPDGIGTFVHEFSHVLGLPDLYHTTSADATYTPGEYSILDYGPYNNDSRTPPNYGAYECNALGWSDPIMLDGPISVTLEPITTGQFGLIPTEKTTEFFLFENRQQTGWDTFIPSHGMLIWHIDYVKSVFDYNTVNNTKSHQYVDIVEANNNPNNTSLQTMRGYPFPGSTGKTEFTSTTTPALKSWSGRAIDLPVTNITESNGIITFDVAGGGNQLAVPLPTVSTPGTSDRYFDVSWAPVENAVDYFLTVYVEDESDNSGTMVNGFDNSFVGAGWSASASDWYTTTDNYGDASPSFKFSKMSQTLTSPTTDGDISKIEFWIKGQNNSSGTYLTIDGYDGSKWQQIDRITPETNKIANISINDIPAGICQIRFTMTKAVGNIAIDDIVITYGTGAEILEGYNDISTNGETGYRVDKLRDGATKYSFTVMASDGKKRSNPSERVYVTVAGMTGVEDIVVGTDDSKPVYYNLQGVRMDRPAAGSVVIERRGTKVRKLIVAQ